MRPSILIHLAALFSILLLSMTSFAKTYYVSPNGSDSNPGTLSQPWKTIAKANSTLLPGDTVYIRGGTYYGDQIRPINSGSSGIYITYTNYGSEKVTLTNISTAVNLDNREYIKIDGITIDGQNIGTSANVKTWVSMQPGNYNIIQNCTLKKARGWGGIKIGTTSHHNQIKNNTMQYCGNWNDDNGDMIEMLGDRTITPTYNLIEGNDLSFGGHNLLSLRGKYNVVRNNYFYNPWERCLELQYLPYHGLGGPTEYNLFEGNRIAFTSPASDNPIPPGLKIWSPRNIIRKNLFYKNVSYGIQSSALNTTAPYVDHNKIYNNVFYDNGRHGWAIWDYDGSGTQTDSNIFKNNIVYNNYYGSKEQIWLNLKESNLNNNEFHNNDIIDANANQGVIKVKGIGAFDLSWYEKNYPSNFINNIEANPLFVDVENDDYHLQSNSPCIDAGTFLTRTIGSGSGTKIVVEDAGYFCDGFDIVDGDLIQLEGQVERTRIVQVNYGTNTLVIDKPLSWHAGQGVSLPYIGSAPDIGAFEYNSDPDLDPPSPPSGLSIIGK